MKIIFYILGKIEYYRIGIKGKFIMKFDFDEFSFQDEINLMNLNHQMENQQMNVNTSFGFNNDAIYHKMESKDITKN